MTSAAATICWGVAAIAWLALPQVATPPPPTGQAVPPPATAGATPPAAQTPPAPKPPYEIAWTHAVESTDRVVMHAGPVVVVLVSDGQPVRAVSAADGTLVWTAEVASAGPVAFGDGLVYFVGTDQISAVDEGTGQPQWGAETPSKPISIAWFPGGLLAASATELLAYRVVDGALVWRAPLPAPPSSAPVAADGRIAIATSDATLLSFELTTGRPLRQQKVVTAPAALVPGGRRLYYLTPDGTACAFDAASLSEDWCYALAATSVGTPLVGDGRVHVVLKNNVVYVLDAGSGNQRRRATLPGRAAGAPGLVAGRVVALLADGALAAVDPATGRVSVALRPAPDPERAGARPALDASQVAPDGSGVYRLMRTLDGHYAVEAIRPTPAAPPVEGKERRY